MFRILLVIATIGVAYFLYDAYGYRYYLSDIRKDKEESMVFGDTINPDINIVAYFDYASPSSKRLYPLLLNLVAAEKNVQVILRPIATNINTSEIATRIALAAKNQGRFMDFNNIILSTPADIDEKYIEGAVRSLGMDYDKLKFDFSTGSVEEEILQYQREMALLAIPQLPFFYINHVKMPGAAYTVRELQVIIDDLRTGRR